MLIASVKFTPYFNPHHDHLGSTRAVLNGTTGSGSEVYAYDAWGKIITSYVSPDIRYTYTGQEYDCQTHLYNFRARMYDSDIGRFYTTDPAGSTYAPYGYARQNPISFVDPTGKIEYIGDRHRRYCYSNGLE